MLNYTGIIADNPVGNSDTLGNNNFCQFTLDNSHFLPSRIVTILVVYIKEMNRKKFTNIPERQVEQEKVLRSPRQREIPVTLSGTAPTVPAAKPLPVELERKAEKRRLRLDWYVLLFV